MLHEMWIVAEIVILPVLKDEDSVVLQQSFLEDEAGDRWQFFQGIGRIGEDKVKLLFAGFDDAEHIAAQAPPRGTGTL